MDLSNYAGLCTAVAAFLNREDLTVAVPAFVKLAEAKLKRELRRTRARTSASFIADQDYYNIPSSVAELLEVYPVTGSPSEDLPLAIVAPAELAQLRTHYTSVGRPRYGAVVGNRLLLVPTPDESYAIRVIYNAALVPLSDSNTTNAVLTEAPDLYVYGALCEAEPYLEHDERLPMWQARFDAALKSMNNLPDREAFSAGTRRIPLPIRF